MGRNRNDQDFNVLSSPRIFRPLKEEILVEHLGAVIRVSDDTDCIEVDLSDLMEESSEVIEMECLEAPVISRTDTPIMSQAELDRHLCASMGGRKTSPVATAVAMIESEFTEFVDFLRD